VGTSSDDEPPRPLPFDRPEGRPIRSANISALVLSGAMDQMFAEKLDRAAPGEFGGLAVVDGHALLVHKGVLGVITVELERLAGGFPPLPERMDPLRGAPIVFVGEMSLQRDLDVGGLGRLPRRNAIEHPPSRKLWNLGGADNGYGTAEAEAG